MTGNRNILHRLRPALYGAAVVGLVGAMGLGLAAPAEAFSPGGYAPEPVMTSSELAAIGEGVAAEGATAAGSSAVAAFAPIAPLAVAFGGFRIGFSMVGDVLAPFGIDNSANVCQLTGGGGGPIGNTAVSLLTGADCNQYKVTADPKTLNADAPAGVTGGQVCYQAYSAYCITLERVAQYPPNPTYGGLCMSETMPLASVPVTVRIGLSFVGGASFEPSSGGDTGQNTASVCPAGQLWINLYHGGSMLYTQAQKIQSYGFANSAGNAWLGTPATVTQATGDPTRHWECDVTGSDGTLYSATSADFTWSGGSTPPYTCPKLPAGVLPSQTEVDLVTPSLNPPKSVWIGPITPTKAFTDAATAYPECASSSCHLQVWAGSQNCATAGTCADWFADPNKDQDYQCHYGTHVVALSECNTMSTFYDPQKQAAGQAYADPATGQPVMKPDPTTGVETPVQTSQKGDESNTDPLPNPDDGPTSCWPSGWGIINPVTWVQAGGCVLRQAFVARPSVVKADMDRIDKGPSTKMPAQIIATVNAWHINTPGSDCSGIVTPALGNWFPSIRIMQACPGDMLATVAMWTRVFCDLGFAVLGFNAIRRNIGRIVQYGGGGE